MTTALYRRYRPETFADVIGQEHVTEPLMQALRSGRVNHAYLFSGPRGCGKTTSARILARCLNCEQGPTPDPCGTCESCVSLARGGPGSVDVIEIDAASHGGVDDARDLRERAAFGPAQSRYKVYIIDEAHMVTPHGFNALLKVVEEPPEHVKFIFATTEPEKVLSTIRSRTHHYPFHLVPPQRLTAYLEELCEAEGVALEQGVLSFVTRAGGGSVRDSLSVLDQLMAGAGDEGLTYERTASLLGFTDVELLDAVVDAVAAADAASVFSQVNKVMESGHDPRRFVEDLLERYRDLIVVAAVGDRTGGLLRGLPEDQVARLRQQAGAYGPSALTRSADVVSRGLSEMTGAVSSRMHLELICARLLLPAAEGESGHAARLDRIERRLAAGSGVPAAAAPASAPVAAPSGPPAGPSAPQSRPEPSEAQPPAEPDGAAEPREQRGSRPPAAEEQPPQQQRAQEQPVQEPPAQASAGRAPGSLDTDAVRRAWPEVLDRIKDIRKVTWTFVSVNSRVLDFDGQRLLLGIGTAGLANTFSQGHHAEVVRQALIEAIGLDTRVEGVPMDNGGGPGTGPGSSGPGGPSGGPPAPAGQGGPEGQGRGADPSMAEQLGAPGGHASRGRPTAGEPAPPDWSARSGAEGAPAWATQGPGGPQPPGPATDVEADPRGSGDQRADDQRSIDRTPRDRNSGGETAAADPGAPAAGGPAAPAAGVTAAPAAPVPVPGGDVPDDDDEDLETSGAVGQPVVESVLGGTVIAIDEEYSR